MKAGHLDAVVTKPLVTRRVRRRAEPTPSQRFREFGARDNYYKSSELFCSNSRIGNHKKTAKKKQEQEADLEKAEGVRLAAQEEAGTAGTATGPQLA